MLEVALQALQQLLLVSLSTYHAQSCQLCEPGRMSMKGMCFQQATGLHAELMS